MGASRAHHHPNESSVCVYMAGPPDASLTMYSILDDNWNTDNVAKPYFCLPTTEKRLPTENEDVTAIYSVARVDAKEGISNAHRTRRDKVTVDISTVVSRSRLDLLAQEILRIMDLSTVRSSPTTRPRTAVDDDYDADAYDQFIPQAMTSMEDKNRKWWRVMIEGEFLQFWQGR